MADLHVTNYKKRTYLRLNADFNDTASDSEHVAYDEEDEPAINELQTICPAHFSI